MLPVKDIVEGASEVLYGRQNIVSELVRRPSTILDWWPVSINTDEVLDELVIGVDVLYSNYLRSSITYIPIGHAMYSCKANFAQEWKSYTEDPESITEIMHLGYMLGHEDKPKEVQTMRLIGVLHDTLKSRYGLVFDPDEYIAKVLPNERNLASISKSRKPLTLTSLLRGSPETSELKGHPDASDLALRFRLARQLASNVFVLHNAGWIHKGYSQSASAISCNC